MLSTLPDTADGAEQEFHGPDSHTWALETVTLGSVNGGYVPA